MTTTTLPTPTVTVSALTTSTVTSVSTFTTETELVVTTVQTSVVPATQSTVLTLVTVIPTAQTEIDTVTAPTSTVLSFVTTSVVSTPTTYVPIPTFKVEMIPVAGGPSLYFPDPERNGAMGSTTTLDSAGLYIVDIEDRLVSISQGTFSCFMGESGSASYYLSFFTQSRYETYKSTMDLVQFNYTVNGDSSLTFAPIKGNDNTFSYYTLNQQFFYSTPGFEGFPTYTAKIHPA